MADTLLPGEILAMNAGAAERLIATGNGDAALLYLWLLKHNGTYQSVPATRALRWDAERADAALSVLAGLGLANEEKRETATASVHSGPPEYSAADLTQEMENKNSPFPALVQEVQRRLGKILSTSDLKCLYTIYDFIALPAEVILLTVSWCVQEYAHKYGPGRVPRLPQIQKEAMHWKERGIDTLETAEAYVKHLHTLRDRTMQIMALLDIRDRPAVTRERDYIESWLNMGFDDSVIRQAYERTVLKKRTLNWAYMNSILRSWHQKGLHTQEEIQAGDLPLKPSAGKSGLGATAPQPVPAGEAARQTEEDMEWVRRFVEEQSGEGK